MLFLLKCCFKKIRLCGVSVYLVVGSIAYAQQPAISTDSVMTTPVEHVRGVEQTFLTYPEWFLVFSPAEYAAFVRQHSPTDFPFMGHVGQFWSGYRSVVQKSRSMGHDLNTGYHVMIMVIGISTTVEYTLRAIYEGTLGALSNATSGGVRTAEEEFAAHVAQDYVNFIRVLPWYEYDFWKQLKLLWVEVPIERDHVVRCWERRFALTTEYGTKAIYALLIKAATQMTYEPALLVTAIEIKPLPAMTMEWSNITVLDHAPNGAAMVTVPRYDAFMSYAKTLAIRGADFQQIAGNQSVILVSLLGQTGWQPQTGVDEILFVQPILTQHGRQRVVVTMQVRGLAKALREWTNSGVEVEHIFDY